MRRRNPIWRRSGAAPYEPRERYILFELDVDEASSTVYEGKTPVRRRWRVG